MYVARGWLGGGGFWRCMVDGTYSAYCITPFLGSWLVSGKSLGNTLVEPAPAWGWTWEALLVDEEEMEAAAMRKGTREVVGLAVFSRKSLGQYHHITLGSIEDRAGKTS